MDQPPRPLAYPWEGPPTAVKSRRGRGSALGSSMAGNPWHRLAGRDGLAQERSGCGLVFASGTTVRAVRDIEREEARHRDPQPRCTRPGCWD